MNMASTVRVSIRVKKYLWKEFIQDVVRDIIIPLIPFFRLVVRVYRPITLFLGEIVVVIKKILLLIIALLFGFISMIVIFGIPFAFVYGVMTQK